MKNVCVLVDFTETSKVAIRYACAVANKAQAKLQVLHVIDAEQDRSAEEMKNELEKFSGLKDICQTNYEFIIEEGEFMESIPSLLKEHKTDLAVIATHGVKGIFHTMQGAEVLKLIQKLGVPSLILQEGSPVEFQDFETVLFPIASHANFEVKINQTAMLAKVFDAEVIIYLLTPEKGELNEALASNLERTERTFKEQGIRTQVVKETSKVYGIGYAKQALDYTAKNNIELFSIMAHASDDLSYFGNVERSEFILNKKGIPVLCCTE